MLLVELFVLISLADESREYRQYFDQIVQVHKNNNMFTILDLLPSAKLYLVCPLTVTHAFHICYPILNVRNIYSRKFGPINVSLFHPYGTQTSRLLVCPVFFKRLEVERSAMYS